MTNSPMDPTVITEKELKALKQFKDRIQDILPMLSEYNCHDVSLLRWLRARELNITQSEDMLRKSIAWREKNDVHNRLNWKVPDAFGNDHPYYIPGFDKNGNIVICCLTGRWVLPKTVTSEFKSDLISYVDQILEVMMKISELKSTNSLIKTQCCLIIDYEGYTMRQLTSKHSIQFALEVARRLEANYPEILCTAWAINFTNNCIYHKNVEGHEFAFKVKWKETDLLPAKGEKWKDTDFILRLQNYKIAHGLDNFPVHKIFPENSEFISVTIDAGGKHMLKYTLSKNSKLYWNFRTDDYDIGFSFVYYNVDLSADEVIFECARADSHLHLQTGEFVADKPGTCTLVFDNSFSRFRKKSLFYCVRSDTDTGDGGLC